MDPDDLLDIDDAQGVEPEPEPASHDDDDQATRPEDES